MTYKDIIISKNGEKIPLFQNGNPMNSKYNPVREVETFISTLSASDYFIVYGLGAGFHLKEALKKFPDSFFLIVEEEQRDFDFIFTNFEELNFLKTKENIQITTLKNFNHDFLNTFLPHKYNTIGFIEQRSWIQNNATVYNSISNSLKESFNSIILDYNTQAHFGKIWQRNIFSNLKYLSNKPTMPKKSKAIIIAAGPSLDSKIQEIKKLQNDYCLISTDTAFQVMQKHSIFCDYICSIDGQFYSTKHFKKLNKNSVYILDMQANPSITRKLQKNDSQIIFTGSNHPLIQLYNTLSRNKIPVLSSGNGTVTIHALDFALHAGFSEIKVFGADFAYTKNKTYAKGTYLDSIFGTENKKINSFENQFASQFYRTELIKSDIDYTTKVLESYKNSFLDFLNQNKIDWTYKDYVYTLKNQNQINIFENNLNSDFTAFSSYIKQQIEKLKDNFDPNNPLVITQLPFIAYLKNRNKHENKEISFESYCKLALENIVRYI